MTKEVKVPDIGDFSNVEIIEVLVKVGDTIAKEDPLIVLETDKATVEVPAPYDGVVEQLAIKTGDRVSKGSLILLLQENKNQESKNKENKFSAEPKEKVSDKSAVNNNIYASPGVRRLAREVGVNLAEINGSGRKNRILKEDIQQFIGNSKNNLQDDFGEIVEQPLNRIKKISGSFLHKNWTSIPHVTQFEEVDITELENFRQQQKNNAQNQGIKLTPIVFIMKAVVSALKQFPEFNAQLSQDGNNLLIKKYFNIGVAVDTNQGLVVPIVRKVDQKGLFELAKDLATLSSKAREGKLAAKDMQGGCFTISSLGGIGGTFFTPIINAPEVAILGVSKAKQQLVYIDGEFKPRLMLPLSLSYDHRVIDGADGARFISFLSKQLSDIRQLLL